MNTQKTEEGHADKDSKQIREQKSKDKRENSRDDQMQHQARDGKPN